MIFASLAAVAVGGSVLEEAGFVDVPWWEKGKGPAIPNVPLLDDLGDVAEAGIIAVKALIPLIIPTWREVRETKTIEITKPAQYAFRIEPLDPDDLARVEGRIEELKAQLASNPPVLIKQWIINAISLEEAKITKGQPVRYQTVPEQVSHKEIEVANQQLSWFKSIYESIKLWANIPAFQFVLLIASIRWLGKPGLELANTLIQERKSSKEVLKIGTATQ